MLLKQFFVTTNQFFVLFRFIDFFLCQFFYWFIIFRELSLVFGLHRYNNVVEFFNFSRKSEKCKKNKIYSNDFYLLEEEEEKKTKNFQLRFIWSLQILCKLWPLYRCDFHPNKFIVCLLILQKFEIIKILSVMLANWSFSVLIRFLLLLNLPILKGFHSVSLVLGFFAWAWQFHWYINRWSQMLVHQSEFQKW